MRLLRRSIRAALLVFLVTAVAAACTSAEEPPTDEERQASSSTGARPTEDGRPKTTSADAPPTEEELLDRYSPELWLSPRATAHPMDVEKALADPGTELRTGGPRGDVVARGGDPKAPLTLQTIEAADWSSEDTLAFTRAPEADPGFAYGDVTTSGNRLLLDYWYAYPHSTSSRIIAGPVEFAGIGVHHGDWERIVVVVDRESLALIEVAYAAHEDATAVSADRVPRGTDGRRPRAYVAEGSNAAYPAPGPHPIELPKELEPVLPDELKAALDDTVEVFDETVADGAVVLTPDVRVRGPWAAKALYWGQSRLGLENGLVTVDSPRGPDVHRGTGRQSTAAELVAKARR